MSTSHELTEAQKKAQDMILAWQATQRHGEQSLAHVTGDERIGLVWRKAVALLVDTSLPARRVYATYVQRRRRAQFCVAGMVAAQAFVQSTRMQSVQREVIAQIPAGLCDSDGAAARGVIPNVGSLLSIGGTQYHSAITCVTVVAAVACGVRLFTMVACTLCGAAVRSWTCQSAWYASSAAQEASRRR
jgi:hypothetical protein